MGYYIRVNHNVKLFVKDIGKGRPVLMVHGWPLNNKMFEYQMNILPSYGIRVIAPDLRGFGKSDRPFDGYSYDQMAENLKVGGLCMKMMCLKKTASPHKKVKRSSVGGSCTH